MYGHVEGLARRMKRGADSVDGVEAVLYRVPETLPDDVLAKMWAPHKDDSIPVIGSPLELTGADGFLFGFPTRYGCMAAQMKAFFDSTGQLWKEQKLAGKPAGFFVSTGTQGGGQETTAWTAITQLAHHGMLFVPIGYTFGAGMFKMDSARGGSPYGSGVFAGDGSREPSETELALAEHQGQYMAATVKKLARATRRRDSGLGFKFPAIGFEVLDFFLSCWVILVRFSWFDQTSSLPIMQHTLCKLFLSPKISNSPQYLSKTSIVLQLESESSIE
ncbi:hypothetical protein DH2020_040775 [Rehmannia glutinosa]|uniref:NAD(P)H dehydrogenase (quinone) n=1 Tax=Rehmannia glutinosa TaxID=99300 RepID=A0ABR0US21_REHGL